MLCSGVTSLGTEISRNLTLVSFWRHLLDMNGPTPSRLKRSTFLPVLDFQLMVLDPPVSSWVPITWAAGAMARGSLVSPVSPRRVGVGSVATCVLPQARVPPAPLRVTLPSSPARRWKNVRMSGLSRTVSPSTPLRRQSWWQPGKGLPPTFRIPAALVPSEL